MIKIGLIGCGGIGSNHALCYGALSASAELAAVADLDDAKTRSVTDKFGCKAYRTGEELIAAGQVDAVDICLPTFLHAHHAVMAMERGMDVFIEKPVCLTMEEAELLLQAQQRTGAQVQVGQVIRFWNEYVWLKQTVDASTYGKVVSGVFTRLSAKPRWSWEDWYSDPARSGTMALDLHIHDVDYVRYLMGEPDEISARATRDGEGVLQQIFTTYRYGDAVLTAEGSWDYPSSFPFSMDFRVKLERATVVKDASGFMVYLDNGAKFSPELQHGFDREEEISLNVSSLEAYYNELKYFTERLASGQPLDVAPLSEAVQSLKLALREIELAGGAKKE